jgi:DNA-binding transcriptional ArsR family regulator
MDRFSALADPTRRRIVEMLASGGTLSASDIGGEFTMSAPAISQHLKILREAGLVQVEKKAQQRLYSMDEGSIAEMEQWLGNLRRFWTQRLDTLEALLKADDSQEKTK